MALLKWNLELVHFCQQFFGRKNTFDTTAPDLSLY